MDILYILGNGSRWNNNEIKYSLRSLEKHGQNYDRVFITGEKPHFINDNIIYNYCPDSHIPTITHFNKVLHTFKNTDISDNILLMYDDIFFKKSVDIEKYPYYYKREIPANYKVNNFYTNALTFTRNLLLKLGKPIKDFDIHTPIIYNRQKFYEMEKIVKQNFNFNNPKSVGVAVRSLYCNFHNIEGELKADLKISENLTELKIEQTLKNESVFSIANAIYNNMMKYLAKTYPQKSKWEK